MRIPDTPAWRYTYYEDGLLAPFWGGIRWYCKGVDGLNNAIGHVVMYGLFVMMGILSWAVFTNLVLKSPTIWVMEMAQFSMAAYYLLGGGYTMQQEAHVRMDVLYDRFSPKLKAMMDVGTGIFLLAYLGILVWGGISSTAYAFEFNQKNYTSWRPPLAPIKTIMTLGMVLMLAQGISIFLKDLARVLGRRGWPDQMKGNLQKL